jgi:hypothetical protein
VSDFGCFYDSGEVPVERESARRSVKPKGRRAVGRTLFALAVVVILAGCGGMSAGAVATKAATYAFNTAHVPVGTGGPDCLQGQTQGLFECFASRSDWRYEGKTNGVPCIVVQVTGSSHATIADVEKSDDYACHDSANMG